MKRILAINPGSTSTKIAVYEDEQPMFVRSIPHSAEELAPFDSIYDQLDFRTALVRECLKNEGVELSSLSAVVARGGLIGAVKHGAYEVNEEMLDHLLHRAEHEHASNLGALIADRIARQYGIKAYIYDGVTVDEMDEINRYTGFPEMRRKGRGHNLNTRAAALRYAEEEGKNYDDITVIVAHLGGGISVNLHTKGHIADFISDDEGPFSPERSGWLPIFTLVEWCYSGKYTYKEMMGRIKNRSGLVAFCGTNDSREVERMIAEGDEKAKMVYDSMALGVAKNIAKLAPCVNGKVDAVILTGGIAYSDYFVGQIRERVSFLAPVVVYPGEDEMRSLSLGCLRVLNGVENAEIYVDMEK